MSAKQPASAGGAPGTAGRGDRSRPAAAGPPARGRTSSPAGEHATEDEGEDGPPPAPWHFKVLLVGTAGYLVYRFVWFIFWLTGHAWHG